MKRTLPAIIVMLATVLTVLMPYHEAQATRYAARHEAWLAGQAMRTDGYRLTDAAVGFLGYRRNTFVKIYMFAGVETGVFVAGCKDAFRLGIDIYDPTGRYISSDNRAKHRPYQHVSPKTTGWYWVRINMNDSTNNGAHYSVVLGTK